MYEYYKYLKEINEDYERNKEKYFQLISQIAKKYGGKAYLFGSQLKGNAIASSDVDILVEIPDNVYWLNVYVELREKVRNPKFEFHVYNFSQAEVMKKLIKEYKELG